MTEQTQIHFELVSPEKILVSENLRLAVIPGDEGEFGVLPGHAALIASLKPGIVKLYQNDNDKNPRRIFISGGFADVTPERCIVLAEEAVNIADLKESDLRESLKNLEDDLTLAQTSTDRNSVKEKIRVVKAKLFALNLAA